MPNDLTDFDVRIGFKHPVVGGTTAWHEFSSLDLNCHVTVAYSVGVVEIAGVEPSIGPDGLGLKPRIGGLKTDLFSHGAYGGMMGVRSHLWKELGHLCCDVKQYRQGRDILSKAVAWFAQNDVTSRRSSSS